MNPLEVLLVENKEAKDLEKGIKDIFRNYSVRIAKARDYHQLRTSLETGRYDLAFIDCDFGGDWRIDVIETTKIINEIQPSCIRVIMSIMPKSLFPDYFKSIAQISTDKNTIRTHPQLIKKELENYGFKF